MIKDPLCIGLTRPTLVLGVTDTAFIFNMMATGILFLASNSLLMLLMAIPVHICCYLICKYEPRQFELLWMFFNTKLTCLNRKQWGGSSAAPLGNRK